MVIKDGAATPHPGFLVYIYLGAWTLWCHRNRCVFDGASPMPAARSISYLMSLVLGVVEFRSWSSFILYKGVFVFLKLKCWTECVVCVCL